MNSDRLSRIAGLIEQASADLKAERFFDAELHLREAANAAHWVGGDLRGAIGRASDFTCGAVAPYGVCVSAGGHPGPHDFRARGLDNPAGAGESVEAARG